MPTLKQLIARHPEHEKHADHWRMLAALAAGGSMVSPEVKQKLLINPDGAELEIIKDRIQLAPYEPIMGSILMKLTSQVTQHAASYDGSTDPYWENEFYEQAFLSDRGSTSRQSFHNGLTDAFFNALTQGKMIGVVDVPRVQARSLAEQRALGGDKAFVALKNRWDLWDWASDEKGFIYAKLYRYSKSRDSWDSSLSCQHEFTLYVRQSNGSTITSQYLVKPDENHQDYPLEDLRDGNVTISANFEDSQVFSTTNGLTRFPVVEVTIESPLFIADQLFDLTRSHYNHVAGGEWALVQTNYAMPVFNGVEDPHVLGNSNPASNQKTGNGRYLELPPGITLEWVVRPGNDIQLSLNYQQQQKQKMLDVVHKIAESAASSYAMRMQSGESKKEGRRELDILLEVYGQSLRQFAKGLLDVAAVAHNEDVSWKVNGFSDYNTSGLKEDLESFLALDQASIDSPTLKRESRLAIANKAIQRMNLPPEVSSQVAEELSEDSAFALSPDGARVWIELAKVGYASPEMILEVFSKAGLVPPDADIRSMLSTLGISGEEPQTNSVIGEG